MIENKTITTHICDICGARDESRSDQSHGVTLAIARGVTIKFGVFGVVTNEAYVCSSCQRKAVLKWTGN